MILSSDSLVTKKDVSFCQSDVKFESLFSQGSPNVNKPMLKNERHSTGYREYIDLECDTPNGYSCDRNLESTPWDPDLTIVRETPGLNGSPSATVSKYFAGKECSSLGVTPSVSELPGPLFSSPISVVNSSLAPKSVSLAITPERLINIEENDDAPSTQSPYHLSVNSSFLKRRKSFKLSSESPQAMQSGTTILRSPNCATFMDEKLLQISCSICKTPLGLPSNDLFVTCSSVTSSKVYLTSILKMKMLSFDDGTPGIPVIIADISSVNQRILEDKDRSP